LIASGSQEGYLHIYSFQNKKIILEKSIKHPFTVIGVSWSPFYKYYIASACKDGFIRIYDIEKLIIS